MKNNILNLLDCQIFCVHCVFKYVHTQAEFCEAEFCTVLVFAQYVLGGHMCKTFLDFTVAWIFNGTDWQPLPLQATDTFENTTFCNFAVQVRVRHAAAEALQRGQSREYTCSTAFDQLCLQDFFICLASSCDG